MRTALHHLQHVQLRYYGSDLRLAGSSSTGEEGYEVWGEAASLLSLWHALSREAPRFAALPCGAEALESLRIEAGIPRYGPDMSEDTIPLEAGLWSAISFTKGCYIGQEVIERLRSRGHVNWTLAGALIDSPSAPRSGEKLLGLGAEGKEVGAVTSSCVSPTLSRTIALAFVRREFSHPGTRLALASGHGVEIVELPFYRRA